MSAIGITNCLVNGKGTAPATFVPTGILIYRIEGDTITFERTGTHSDLFE